MRIATCNVRHGRPVWRRRPDHPWVASALRALDADVIGLQEVDRRTRRSGGVDQPALISAATGAVVAFGAALDHDGGEYGVALAVRGAIRSSELVRLPGGGEPRVALVADVEPAAERRPWTIACTHLSTTRAVAAEQLDAVLDAVERTAGDGPSALLGDLNLGPGEVLAVLQRRGWSAAPTGATHPASRPTRRIDWIAVRSARVVGSVVPALEVSDHRPVVALVDANRVDPYPEDPGGGLR